MSRRESTAALCVAAAAVWIAGCSDATSTPMSPNVMAQPASAGASPTSTNVVASQACSETAYLIDLAEEARQGNGTGEDSWIAGQRITAAKQAAPDEIKPSAARVAAALFDFMQHPDFLDKVNNPVFTHDLTQMQQWRSLHC